MIVKTGTDLRQEQLATQLIERFSRIWKDEKSDCWARLYVPIYLRKRVVRLTTSFRILITGEQSGLVETITDAVSVHSIKKGEYARRVAEGEAIGTVSLMDHFVAVCPPLYCTGRADGRHMGNRILGDSPGPSGISSNP